MGAAERWSPDELSAPDAYIRLGAMRGSPCVVIDEPTDDCPLPAGLPAVVIALVKEDMSVEAADVVVATDDDLAVIVDAVAASPRASVVLAQLLRLQQTLSPLNALAAESFAYSTLQGGHEFAQWLAGRGARVRKPDAARRVRVEFADGGRTALVTLDRPRLFNLYDAAMRDALVEAMSVVVADVTVSRVELRGAGKSFCAGGDPAEFGTTHDTALAHLIRTSANAAPLMLAAAHKLHALVQGAAVGAGCELAAFASHVTATADATFSLPEVSMGLIPGAGGTVSVTSRIGRHRTAWMALTGARIDATTALAWGLVDAITAAR